MTVWGLLAAGGAVGALARYVLTVEIQRRSRRSFPVGTLIVNLLGSFLLGVVVTGLAASPYHVQLGALLAVGLLGDFTTFSTLAYEAVTLARSGQRYRALLYVAGSTALGVAAVVAGMVCGAVLS